MRGYKPLCPMPVIRRRYVESTDSHRDYWAACDEPVFLERLRFHVAFDGEWDTGDESWQLTCAGGHKILLPDTEGNDCYAIDPPPFETIARFLQGLRSGLHYREQPEVAL